MPILRSFLSCAGLLGALISSSPAVAGPPVVKKIDTSKIVAADKAVVPKLKAPPPGVSTSLKEIAGAMSIPESELGTRVTLTAATPRVGQTYMRLLGALRVDPSIPQIDFLSDKIHDNYYSAAMLASSSIELHFLAKAGKSYFIECEATTKAPRDWILGTTKPVARILTTTAAERPMFVYTAEKDGDPALHFTLRKGEWSLSRCQITPVA